MARPEMTEEQRVVAVTMLANAIRKADREDGAGSTTGDPILDAVGRRRGDAARQYVRGMEDLLAVLFAEGRPGAEALVAAARALARGGAAGRGERGDG